MTRTIPLAVLLALLTMAPACPPSAVAPVVRYDAGADAPLWCLSPYDACCASCGVLVRLGCREGMPTASGRTCYDVCDGANSIVGIRLPDVSTCGDVACVRAAGVACE